MPRPKFLIISNSFNEMAIRERWLLPCAFEKDGKEVRKKGERRKGRKRKEEGKKEKERKGKKGEGKRKKKKAGKCCT